MPTCPFCGATLPPNSRFCNQCGKMIQAGPSAPGDENTSGSRRRKPDKKRDKTKASVSLPTGASGSASASGAASPGAAPAENAGAPGQAAARQAPVAPGGAAATQSYHTSPVPLPPGGQGAAQPPSQAAPQPGGAFAAPGQAGTAGRFASREQAAQGSAAAPAASAGKTAQKASIPPAGAPAAQSYHTSPVPLSPQNQPSAQAAPSGSAASTQRAPGMTGQFKAPASAAPPPRPAAAKKAPGMTGQFKAPASAAPPLAHGQNQGQAQGAISATAPFAAIAAQNGPLAARPSQTGQLPGQGGTGQFAARPPAFAARAAEPSPARPPAASGGGAASEAGASTPPAAPALPAQDQAAGAPDSPQPPPPGGENAGGADKKPPPSGKKTKKKKRRVLRAVLSVCIAIAGVVAGLGVLEHFYPGVVFDYLDVILPGNLVDSARSGIGAVGNLFGGGDDSAPGDDAAIDDIRHLESLYSVNFFSEDPSAGSGIARGDGTLLTLASTPSRRSVSLDLTLTAVFTRAGGAADADTPALGTLTLYSGTGTREEQFARVREDWYFNTHTKTVYYITQAGELHRWSNGSDTLLASSVGGVAASANDEYVLYRSAGTLYTLPTQTPGAQPEMVAAVHSTVIPLALSSNGGTAYYADPAVGTADSVVIYCARKGGAAIDSIQARPKQSGYAYLSVSYTGASAIVYAENGVWMCKDGSFKLVGIGSGEVSTGSRSFAPNYSAGAKIYAAYRATARYDTFAFTVDGELYLQHGDGEARAVDTGVTAFELSQDGDCLTWLSAGADGEGVLHRGEITGGALAAGQSVVTGVAAYDNSRDGNHLYYLTANADGATATLYYHSPGDTSDTAIADNVWLSDRQSRYFGATPDGMSVCYISGYNPQTQGGALYAAIDQGESISLVGSAGAILGLGGAGGTRSLLFAEGIRDNAYNEGYFTASLNWYNGAETRLLLETAGFAR